MAGNVRKRGVGGTSSALCNAPVRTERAGDEPGCGGGACTRERGARFERHARRFLERERLGFVAANVVVRGGEIDLVMRERDGTLVFVEVRARASMNYGGAAASVGYAKQRRIVRAAAWIWARDGGAHACRFDVIAFENGRLVWVRDAFRADGI